MSSYATIADLKNATGFNTSKIVKKVNLANLKPSVDKLGIDKLKNVPTNLSNLKSKVVNLKILSDAVKNHVVKKDIYNAKIKILKDK